MASMARLHEHAHRSPFFPLPCSLFSFASQRFSAYSALWLGSLRHCHPVLSSVDLDAAMFGNYRVSPFCFQSSDVERAQSSTPIQPRHVCSCLGKDDMVIDIKGTKSSWRKEEDLLNSFKQMLSMDENSFFYGTDDEGELELPEDFLSPSKDSSREGVTTQKPHLRSWYGKDGELISSFPCPDCRGRGYIVCPTCDVGTPDSSCMECNGKGLKRCPNCLGKRAVLMQPAFEETPSKENATRGPLLQIEDDEIIDRMDINLPPDRKSKRVYSSMPLEVREKIRNALKSLDARTGSVTRRMRRIHNDPILNAKRIAAIKKAKSTEAARKHTSEKLRMYFQEPENRLKRSLSVKGVEYYCSHCGEKGHRRNYCPDLPKSCNAMRAYHCSLCGQPGHKRTNCHSVPKSVKESVAGKKLIYKCRICKEVGHNARSCRMRPEQVQGIKEGGAQN